MKKKLIIFLIIILLIIGVIFGIRKINNSKINYELSKVNSYNYFAYYEDNLYGVINKEGNILIKAEYKKVIIPNPEQDIFVCYDKDENTKILNANGEELFTEYDKVEPIKLKNVASILCYEKSVLKYEKDGKYGLIDFKGKKITKGMYNSIENLQSTEGKFLVSKDEKYGVINLKGTTLVNTKYDSVKTDDYYDNEDYAKSGFIVSNTTSEGYRYGYIDYKGKIIIEPEYNEIIRIEEKEDIYLIISKNGKYGVYKKDKLIIPHEYQLILSDNSDLLKLQKNKKYGMADLNGKIIIPVDYTNLDFKGIYIYASNQKENVVYDAQGNKVDINFNKTINITENNEYRISTIVNNNITYYGIENKDGKILVNEKYNHIEYAFDDYFIAEDENGKLGVINTNGKELIDFKYDSIQKVKNKNMIQVLYNDKTYIYSADLKNVCKMKDAIIDTQDNFIKIYNNKNEKYFDNNGKEISKEDELVRQVLGIPSNIGDYKKIQHSSEDVFYVKK